MEGTIRQAQEVGVSAWALARRQHGVVGRHQLLELGISRQGIRHRIRSGRLHRVRPGVYSVGRPALTQRGIWMAAVIACGEGAILSHGSAAALLRIGKERRGKIEVSIPSSSHRERPGLIVHRRPHLRDADTGLCEGIPVTSPARTLIDLAPRLGRAALERAVNEADKYDLIGPPALRRALEDRAGEPGVRRLRTLLDRRTFRLTKEELERRFLPLAREAGLPVPETGRIVNGFEVDFYWPALGFLVETDGLRYHRTPAEQARDRLRDQAHTAAGLIHLRFTHEQVRYEPAHVRETLLTTVRVHGLDDPNAL